MAELRHVTTFPGSETGSTEWLASTRNGGKNQEESGLHNPAFDSLEVTVAYCSRQALVWKTNNRNSAYTLY